MADWEFAGARYAGCDLAMPLSKRTWCIVEPSDATCGFMLGKGKSTLELKLGDHEHVHWDYCDAPREPTPPAEKPEKPAKAEKPERATKAETKPSKTDASAGADHRRHPTDRTAPEAAADATADYAAAARAEPRARAAGAAPGAFAALGAVGAVAVLVLASTVRMLRTAAPATTAVEDML
jgi:hypothetical protein